MIRYITKLLYKDEHDAIINELKIKKWIHGTFLYKLFWIHIGSIIHTIYTLFKFKFDMDRIDVYLTQKRKDARYQLKKVTDQNIRLNQELEKLKKERAFNETNNS